MCTIHILIIMELKKVDVNPINEYMNYLQIIFMVIIMMI